jgi:hypothetical protein
MTDLQPATSFEGGSIKVTPERKPEKVVVDLLDSDDETIQVREDRRTFQKILIFEFSEQLMPWQRARPSQEPQSTTHDSLCQLGTYLSHQHIPTSSQRNQKIRRSSSSIESCSEQKSKSRPRRLVKQFKQAEAEKVWGPVREAVAQYDLYQDVEAAGRMPVLGSAGSDKGAAKAEFYVQLLKEEAEHNGEDFEILSETTKVGLTDPCSSS